MSRECVICGRPLKTGKKYCYTCRSLQHAKSLNTTPQHKKLRKSDIKFLAFIITIAIIGLFALASFSPKAFFNLLFFILILIVLFVGGYFLAKAIKKKYKKKEANQVPSFDS